MTMTYPDKKLIILVLNDKSGRAAAEIPNTRPPPTK
jgi:hypothetical protein